MIYLGTLGRMVGIKCPSSQSLEMDEKYFFETSVEGKRQAQLKPIQRRTWGIGTSDATTPAQAAALEAFANGEWGPGPFVFVSADAPVTNLLDPAASICDLSAYTFGLNTEITAGGPVATLDGWAGQSYMNTGATGSIFFGRYKIPVLPGQPVTGAAYVRGQDSYVALSFYDINGNAIGTPRASTVKGMGATMTRSFITVTPPAGAVSCMLSAWNTVQSARPSITWTSDLLDWSTGQGCPMAVVHNVGRELIMATAEKSGGRYSRLSYTATEVG